MYRGKRIFDLLLAGAALLLLAPFLFAIGLLIKLSGGGPIFFSHTRIGFQRRPFRLWKFRTMVVGAERQGGQLTVAGDPQVSGFGGWLRRFKIDELPQLWNVLIGDMSLVGPRPEVPRYVTSNDPVWRSILQVRPGVTDPASLVYRNEDDVLAGSADPELHYREFVLPHKLNLSLPYIRQASLWLDVKLVLITVRQVLFPATSWRRVSQPLRSTGPECQGRSKFGPLRRSKSRPVGEGVAVFVGRLERSLRSPFRAAQA